MATERRLIAEAFPPGDFIREELEARWWTQKKLAEVLGRPFQTVNSVVNGRKAVTPRLARELEAALGPSAEFWLNLETAFQLFKVGRATRRLPFGPVLLTRRLPVRDTRFLRRLGIDELDGGRFGEGILHLDLDPPPREVCCQLCLVRLARRHIAVPSPSGRVERADDCASCYEAKYEKPSPAGARFPWPRFTIKAIMILVCLWAIPNALAAWVMRLGDITGTPEQIHLWTIQTFVAVNLAVGFAVAWGYLFIWLIRLAWFNRTGGLVPMPLKLNPDFPPMLLAQEWRTSSGTERVVRVIAVVFSLGLVVAILAGRDEPMLWEFNDWFPVPRAVLVLLVSHIVVMAAYVFSVRRR